MSSINDIFDLYKSKMTQIYLLQRNMQSLSDDRIEDIIKHEESYNNSSGNSPSTLSFHSMSFRTAHEGKMEVFGTNKSGFIELKKEVWYHENKQYQWLLAESYEAFELYLKQAYAYAGHIDNNFWPAHDYGNISISKIKNQPYEWFEEQAKKKSNAPSSIINQFRSRFSNIQVIEENNYFGINLKLAITLLENLRHIIVHNGGQTGNLGKFIDNTLKKAGLYNNGKPDAKHVGLIKAHFGAKEYENTVLLLPIINEPDGLPFHTSTNIFELTTEKLLAYAHVIYQELIAAYSVKINMST